MYNQLYDGNNCFAYDTNRLAKQPNNVYRILLEAYKFSDRDSMDELKNSSYHYVCNFIKYALHYILQKFSFSINSPYNLKKIHAA